MDIYKIVLEVKGIENFTTVMKVVEGSNGIKVLQAGMSTVTETPEQYKRKVSTGHTRNRKGGLCMAEAFREAFKDSKGMHISGDNISKWCVDNGYAATSGTPLRTQLRRKDIIENTDTRGMFVIK